MCVGGVYLSVSLFVLRDLMKESGSMSCLDVTLKQRLLVKELRIQIGEVMLSHLACVGLAAPHSATGALRTLCSSAAFCWADSESGSRIDLEEVVYYVRSLWGMSECCFLPSATNIL